MAVNASINMGVTGISQFKADIRTANESIKTLKSQLALTEKQFEATGNKEEYLKQKTEQLKSMLDAEASQAAAAEKALKAMTDNGVDKSSKAFQDMIRQLATAKTNMIDTQTKIDSLGKEAEETGTQADGLNTNLKNIGKGVGWDNVTSGLKEITDKLESGARAAINFGKKIAQSALGATGFADDILHDAQKYGTDAETIQRMKNLSEFIETDLDTIMNARSRLAKNKDSLPELLGFSADGMSVEDAFWKAGEAIMAMTDEFEKEEAAQKVFGKGWKDLIPLFSAGQEEYNRALEKTEVLTNEQVEQLGKADDAIKQIQQQIELMKNQFWAENADKIIELGDWLLENKNDIVTALGAIAAAFGALKLGEVALNIKKIVNGFNLLKGGGAAGAAASGATGEATAAAGGIGAAGWAGLAGAAVIGAAAVAAADQRRNHADQVRGTDEYLAAQSNGAEGALANWILANRAMSSLDFNDAEEKWAEASAWVEKAREQLDQTEGGAEALSAYSDWRQEHSYGNNDWELPEYLAQAVEQLTGGTEAQKQSNSEMAAAAQGLQGLPADIANAIAQSMAGIGITIDGQMLIGYVNSALGNMVNP